MKTKNKIEVVSISDIHFPFQDDKVVDLEIRFCKDNQPGVIVLHELHDFYAISKFDKDPDRIETLQSEIDQANEFMGKLRKACPKARIVLLNSNHLERLRKFIWRKAPELNSLKVLKLEELLELKKHKVEYKEDFSYKGIHFKHGDVVRKFSGYTAKAEFEKEDVSGVSGHSHRLGVYFHRTRAGEKFWVEGGCGCKLDQVYTTGVTNWQHGFVVLQFDSKGNCFPTAVPIIKYQIMWGDKLYK